MPEFVIGCLNGHIDNDSGISTDKYLKIRIPANEPVPTFAAPIHFNTGCGAVIAEHAISVRR